MIELRDVERALSELYIAAEGAALRREDRKKSLELTALLGELAHAGKDPLLVDAAAGKGYVGHLAALLLGVRRVVVIERDPARIRACEAATAVLGARAAIEVRAADVSEPAAWPEAPDVVVALHACGPASDAVLDAAVRARARWLFLVPCCRGAKVPFEVVARTRADALGIPRQAAVRRAFVEALVDAERTLRLEAAGYEVRVSAFVPPAVTAENLLFRARRVGEPRRMEQAAARHALLCNGGGST